MQILLLRNCDIDYAKWNESISKAFNQLPYAFSWYLDIVSPKWEALVTENYEYVMPLPRKRKYGISYIVQPFLTQQLGVFSKNPVDSLVLNEFIKQIPDFSYELNLNDQNCFLNLPKLPNYVLNLNASYDELASRFSKNTRRNIEKALNCNLKMQTNCTADQFLLFYFSVDNNLNKAQSEIVRKIVIRGVENDALILHLVFSANDKPIAALCILKSANRLIYLLAASNDEGKSKAAMFFLVNSIIQNECMKNILLDFEGSCVDGIARFFKGFGAVNRPYYVLKQFRPAFLIGK